MIHWSLQYVDQLPKPHNEFGRAIQLIDISVQNLYNLNCWEFAAYSMCLRVSDPPFMPDPRSLKWSSFWHLVQTSKTASRPNKWLEKQHWHSKKLGKAEIINTRLNKPVAPTHPLLPPTSAGWTDTAVTEPVLWLYFFLERYFSESRAACFLY